jgi:LPXTG-motif cell wall-anchored protein
MSGESKNKVYLLLGIAGVLVGLGVIFSIRNRRKIVRFSQSLVGQTEIAGNMGFTNEEFQRLMDEVGWQPGDAWCVYFVKLVWYNMAPGFLKKKILSKISGSTYQTWENIKDDKSFIVSSIPKEGDMAIWRTYKDGSPQWSGHAGIVKRLGFGNFTTIEGNTGDGYGNEGYVVAEKSRPIDYTTKNGLRLVGFVRFA